MKPDTKAVDRDRMDPRYQPTKRDLEEDISLPVTPEQLAKAVLSGGAERRED